MADPADVLKAWQHAIGDLGGMASSLAGSGNLQSLRRGRSHARLRAGRSGRRSRALQNQAELLQQGLRRQLEFERELVGRATAPLRAA